MTIPMMDPIHQPDDQLGIHLEKIQSLPVHVGCQHTPDDGQDSGEGGERGSDLLDGNPPCGKGDQDGDGEKQKSQFQPAPFHGGKKSFQMGQFQDEQQAGGGGNDGRASDQSDDDEDDEEQIRIHGHPLSEVFLTHPFMFRRGQILSSDQPDLLFLHAEVEGARAARRRDSTASASCEGTLPRLTPGPRSRRRCACWLFWGLPRSGGLY